MYNLEYLVISTMRVNFSSIVFSNLLLELTFWVEESSFFLKKKRKIVYNIEV